jgi:hypothetical protein
LKKIMTFLSQVSQEKKKAANHHRQVGRNVIIRAARVLGANYRMGGRIGGGGSIAEHNDGVRAVRGNGGGIVGHFGVDGSGHKGVGAIDRGVAERSIVEHNDGVQAVCGNGSGLVGHRGGDGSEKKGGCEIDHGGGGDLPEGERTGGGSSGGGVCDDGFTHIEGHTDGGVGRRKGGGIDNGGGVASLLGGRDGGGGDGRRKGRGLFEGVYARSTKYCMCIKPFLPATLCFFHFFFIIVCNSKTTPSGR